jgi:hypothetical protein
MSIKTVTYREWKDNKLSGSIIPRGDDLPLGVSLESLDNPSLLGVGVSVNFTVFTNTSITGFAVGNYGTLSGLSPIVTEPSKIIFKGLVEKEAIQTRLDPKLDSSIYFVTKAVFPDTAEVTIDEGYFTSKVTLI